MKENNTREREREKISLKNKESEREEERKKRKVMLVSASRRSVPAWRLTLSRAMVTRVGSMARGQGSRGQGSGPGRGGGGRLSLMDDLKTEIERETKLLKRIINNPVYSGEIKRCAQGAAKLCQKKKAMVRKFEKQFQAAKKKVPKSDEASLQTIMDKIVFPIHSSLRNEMLLVYREAVFLAKKNINENQVDHDKLQTLEAIRRVVCDQEDHLRKVVNLSILDDGVKHDVQHHTRWPGWQRASFAARQKARIYTNFIEPTSRFNLLSFVHYNAVKAQSFYSLLSFFQVDEDFDFLNLVDLAITASETISCSILSSDKAKLRKMVTKNLYDQLVEEGAMNSHAMQTVDVTSSPLQVHRVKWLDFTVVSFGQGKKLNNAEASFMLLCSWKNGYQSVFGEHIADTSQPVAIVVELQASIPNTRGGEWEWVVSQYKANPLDRPTYPF